MHNSIKIYFNRIISFIMVLAFFMGILGDIRVNAAIGDDGLCAVYTLIDYMEIEEMGQSGPFWQINLNNIHAFCIDYGATASTGVKYNCMEYCQNEKINKACENFYNGQINDETYIMTQGYIWAVLYEKDPYTLISQIETALHGSYSHEVVSNYIKCIEAANPTKEYGIFHSERDGDQRLISSRENDPLLERPTYNVVSAEAQTEVSNSIAIKMEKLDEESGCPLEGVEFDFYVDDEYVGSGISNENGIASCSYVDKASATGQSSEQSYCDNYESLNEYYKGWVSNAYTSYEEAYKEAYKEAMQNATSNAKALLNEKIHTYTVVEKTSRNNYYYDEENNTWSTTFKGGGEVLLTGVNKYQTGGIVLQKNSDDGLEKSDAGLEGAIYELYAAEDIVHPDGKSGVLYAKGDFVAEFEATREDGKTQIYGLYPGEYVIKEVQPSKGHILSAENYNVHLFSEDSSEPTFVKYVDTQGETIKGQIVITKHMEYFDYISRLLPQKPEEGAEFQIILKKTGQVVDIITTDSEGLGESIMLPFGEYVVHQVAGIEECDFIEDFSVNIEEVNKDYKYYLKDPIFRSLVKIIKTDSETGEAIKQEGIGFQIFDEAGNQVSMVTNYPTRQKIDTFYTSKEGILVLPEYLIYGEYSLLEVKAPNGYDIGEALSFKVSKDSVVKDETGENIIEIIYENTPSEKTILTDETKSENEDINNLNAEVLGEEFKNFDEGFVDGTENIKTGDSSMANIWIGFILLNLAIMVKLFQKKLKCNK